MKRYLKFIKRGFIVIIECGKNKQYFFEVIKVAKGVAKEYIHVITNSKNGTIHIKKSKIYLHKLKL